MNLTPQRQQFCLRFNLIAHTIGPEDSTKFFLRSVILRRVGLRAVSHCAESDSAQYYTAQSREIEMFEIQNCLTLREVELRAVLACAELNNFF